MLLLKYIIFTKAEGDNSWTEVDRDEIQTMRSLIDPILAKWNRAGQFIGRANARAWCYELERIEPAPLNSNARSVLSVYDA